MSLLSTKAKSPTEIANELNISISSVYQHVKELEKGDLVEKIGKKKGKTRSYSLYKANKFIHIVSVIKGLSINKFVTLDDFTAVHLLILSIPQNKYHYYIEKFWCALQKDLEDIDAIIVYGSVARGTARKDSDIDILLVTKHEKLEEKYTKVIGDKRKGKLLMVKTIDKEELRQNLSTGSKFVMEIVKDGIPIYDPKNIFRSFKNES